MNSFIERYGLSLRFTQTNYGSEFLSIKHTKLSSFMFVIPALIQYNTIYYQQAF